MFGSLGEQIERLQDDRGEGESVDITLFAFPSCADETTESGEYSHRVVELIVNQIITGTGS